MNKTVRNSLLLVLTAFIWGVAFLAQDRGGVIGTYTFNSSRFLVSALVLLPCILLFDKLKLTTPPKDKAERRHLWLVGVACGVFLAVASNLQQLGITLGTAVSKAGFLTACYIVFVPVLGLFFKRKCGWNVWLGVGLTLVGLYFLCMVGGFTVVLSDLLVALCSVCFAMQILFIDKFGASLDSLRLSFIQFLVCGVLSAFPAFFVDTGVFTGGVSAWLAGFNSVDVLIAVLYAGIFSGGVAYTLQIVGQKEVHPTVASLLMSLESVFAALTGVIVNHDVMGGREIIGCVLIFTAVILAQLPLSKEKNNL